jgi:hypothetical protein
MTKKTFIEGDIIGRYVIDEFGGTNNKNESFWWVTQNGEPKCIPEKKLRAELARAEWTPEKIRKLSSRAYTELCQEIGEDAIEEIMGASGKKSDAPPALKQYEITAKWWEVHPQIPKTKKNVELFDKTLAELSNPTFTSSDFDRVFEELFPQLELSPRKAGIEGFGEAVTGATAIQKFTSAQLQQLQKSFPVKVPVDFAELSQDEIMVEVAKNTTADGFLEYTKTVDTEKGIEQPVPFLLQADREKTWRDFFQNHPDVSPTDELKQKLLGLLKPGSVLNPGVPAQPGSPLNPGETDFLPVQIHFLENALAFLIEADDPSVTQQESNTYQYGKTRLVVNEPRPKAPIPAFDDSPITVTLTEINKMSAKEYGEKSLNPRFREAVDALQQKIGAR